MKRALGLHGLACTALLLLPCALHAQQEKSIRSPRTELVYPAFEGVRIVTLGVGESRALQPYRVHLFDTHYEYREISVHYAHFSLVGMYGELAAVSTVTGDSALIRFSPWVEGTTGLASSEVTKRARSADFLVTEGCSVSFWHALGLRRSERPIPPLLPRDVSWVLEARRSSDGARMAVLDSIGFHQQQMSDTVSFPTCFGFPDNHDAASQRVDFPLHRFVQGSVYLVWSVIVPNGGEERCNISDVQRFDERVSDASERKTR